MFALEARDDFLAKVADEAANNVGLDKKSGNSLILPRFTPSQSQKEGYHCPAVPR